MTCHKRLSRWLALEGSDAASRRCRPIDRRALCLVIQIGNSSRCSLWAALSTPRYRYIPAVFLVVRRGAHSSGRGKDYWAEILRSGGGVLFLPKKLVVAPNSRFLFFCVVGTARAVRCHVTTAPLVVHISACYDGGSVFPTDEAPLD